MTAPAELDVRFPMGCRTRRIDPANRIKVAHSEATFVELLGWADGVLDTLIVDGWLTLTQRPEQVGAPRGRNSAYAGFSVTNDSERILLRPAHLVGLGMSAGDEILVAVVPEHRAVVMCDPNRIVPVAPRHVTRLLRRDTETLADVTDITVLRAAPTTATRTAAITNGPTR